MRNFLIKLLGGYTKTELAEAFVDGYSKGVENTKKLVEKYATSSDSKWLNTKQKELENNSVPGKVSNSTTKHKVSIVAYASKLGTEIPAYSLRTDKETDTTAPSKHKNVGKNKKKVRPIK